MRANHRAIITLIAMLCPCVVIAQDMPSRRPPPRDSAKQYSIEQAVSDRAQLNTIAFDCLAFLTGDFALDTFLPPGKVSDYFGFQYMRDIDAAEGGHNTSFLTRIAYNMLAALSEEQKAALRALAVRQQDNVAMMTYASEMFSWNAGSLEADTYFCPERHGMYFGGFGMKTAPAVGRANYAISTTLTGDSGEAFLAALTDAQRQRITNLVNLQRQDLAEIVATRRAIASELRRFLKGEQADRAKVLSLSRRYGELDGEMSFLYATAFAQVGRSLTVQQKDAVARMRTSSSSDPAGPFLYSTPIRSPRIESTDFLFGVPKPRSAQ